MRALEAVAFDETAVDCKEKQKLYVQSPSLCSAERLTGSEAHRLESAEGQPLLLIEEAAVRLPGRPVPLHLCHVTRLRVVQRLFALFPQEIRALEHE